MPKDNLYEMPPNWKVSAVALAAKRAGKSYAVFTATDLQNDPSLYGQILDTFREELINSRKEERARIRRRAGQQKPTCAKGGS